ncbi:MAG TPA: hypothetical protein VHF69_03830, partial [Candidatus Synoicihabitans sp.]|nr:hypothetical protein [Candidatus Synoicihabitans sp.]
PLTVPAGSSLLSAESYPASTSGNDVQLKTIAILTVLAEVPPAGSFRPPYAGSDKTIRWNQSQLDYTVLRSLPLVADVPALSSLEAWFEKPIIELKINWTGDYMHPATNSPSYGREISHRVGRGLLSLQLNYTPAQKAALLHRMVQWGIDIYGAGKNGMTWKNDGGHNHGRKPVLILAGAVLRDAEILSWANAETKFIFQEDQQTFYVSMDDVLRPRKTSDGRRRDPYTIEMIGTPEWGGKHTGEPEGDASQWSATYRTVCGASTVGGVLAARLMGLEDTWNWPALFDYIDRYFEIEGQKTSTDINSIPAYVKNMWLAYRTLEVPPFSLDDVAVNTWTSTTFAAQSGSFIATFDMMPSRTDMAGVTGLASTAADSESDLAAVVRFAPSGAIDALNGSTYSAANVLRYAAGVSYRVTLTVDMTNKRYSATVTPAGGSAVTIATDYAFALPQANVAQLDNLSFRATVGAHSVTNVSIAPVAPPPPPPTPVDSWQSVSYAEKTSSFTLKYDLKPTKNGITAVVGPSLGLANEEADLAAVIKLTATGLFRARNGATDTASATLKYSAGVTYSVTLTIDIAKRRYTATVTPAGGKAVVIARNYALNSGWTLKRLNALSHFSAGSAVAISNVSAR